MLHPLMYLNPVRPQSDTCKFDRAGWAPGSLVEAWVLDVDEHVRPGEANRFRWLPRPYAVDPEGRGMPVGGELQAFHVVQSHLVLYR